MKGRDERIYITKLKSAVDKIFDDTRKKRDEMTRYLRQYKGEWWDREDLQEHPHESKVFVNYLFSTVMSVAPLLTDNRPQWSIRARKPFMQKIYNLYSLCLQYLWDKLDMQDRIFKLVLDSMIMKNGVLKVTFDPDAEVFGECRVDVVDPRLYFEAEGYEDNWDNPFQGTRERKPVSWIRSHFPKRGKEVKPDEEHKISDWGDDFEIQAKFATVYEVWMRDNETEDYYLTDGTGKDILDEKGKKQKENRAVYPYGKIVTFTQSVLLNERASMYRHNKPPYVKLYDYIIPHEKMGMGEPDQIEELNRSANRSMQLMDKFMRLYTDPNWMVDANAGLDMQDVKASFPGGGNMYDYNHQMNENPITRVEMGNLPADLYKYVALLPKIIETVSGVTEITQGIKTTAEERTAAETSTLIESAYTRTRQRVRNLEFSVKRTCWLLVDLMQQFYTETRDFSLQAGQSVDYYKVSNQQAFTDNMMKPGEEGDEQEIQDYEQYKEFIAEFGERDEVYAQFDLTIDTDSTLPMDKQSLANLFLRLKQMEVVDAQAVIEKLELPKGKELIARMQKREQQMMAAKQGAKAPRAPITGPQPSMLNSRPEGV